MAEKKDAPIQILIENETKREFFDKCKKLAINPSAWLRNKIYEFLEKSM